MWNTFINLLSQDEQVQCFRNAAAHLIPGGYFVVETLVPRLQGLSLGETVRASAFGPNSADVDEYDVVAQRITSHHYWNDGSRWETWLNPCRYVWPSELISWGTSPEWHSSPDGVVGFASRLPGRARRRSRCRQARSGRGERSRAEAQR